ncbi:VWA domain-containing protein [Brevibacillus nitrificans]|uniref:VWA domain-containing protein n=1 Tax=Brevibacillus nitrificans TaxID=651560 RepID=UPI002E1DA3AF|nr:VWA domain-containing protein [Brevibacillus nitrificans]
MQWMALGSMWFALIIPAILILYLLKRKVEDRVVPSTLLWQRTLQNWEAVRPWEKLRRNLLLFLQLLAALLLVLALLRPAISTEGLAADHTILVIENSGSMQAREGEQTRLQRAVVTAAEWIEKLSSSQTVTLIEAGLEPNVLLTKSGDRQQLLHTLEQLSPSNGGTDTNAALSLAGAIAANEPGSSVIWLGDGEAAAESGAGSVMTADLGHFRFVQMGRTRENTAIGVFVTQKEAQGVNGLVRIDNHGSQQAKGKVTVYDHENKLVDTDSFSVEAGSSGTIVLEQLPASPAYRAVIVPEQDALAQDNEVWSVPAATGRGTAAIVSPAGNRFLHQAIQTAGSLEVESMQQVPANGEGSRDVWIYDGVVPDKLPDGNILVMAPEQEAGWLPYEGKRELDQQPKVTSADDPLLRYVDFADVHVAKTAVLGDMPGMKTLVQAGETDLVRAGTIAGRRVVILGFDLHDSDFPLRPAFPIFMRNAVTWLVSTEAAPIGTLTPFEQLSVPLTPGAEKRVLTDPAGHQEPVQATGTNWMLEVPNQTGLYRLDEELPAGQKSRWIAVQMSEAQSDITPKTMKLAAAITQPGAGETAAAQTLGSLELMPWLAVLALLVVFVEWRVYQRGY